MNSLLPPDFETSVQNAVKLFWTLRLNESFGQEGGRGAVITGKNLDGFATLIRKVVGYCGLPEEIAIVNSRSRLTIPGYFRPTKMWDALVIYKGILLAAFELKSQVGSFGNNFNNRTEEAIGSAHDFWKAQREHAFELNNTAGLGTSVEAPNSARPPFTAYLMVLESSAKSTSPVSVEEKHYKVLPEFYNSSYAKRYQLLCEKLVVEKLYSSTCLILSDRNQGHLSGAYRSPSISHSPKSLFSEFAASLMAAREIYKDL